jgi:hypothetical protein
VVDIETELAADITFEYTESLQL